MNLVIETARDNGWYGLIIVAIFLIIMALSLLSLLALSWLFLRITKK